MRASEAIPSVHLVDAGTDPCDRSNWLATEPDIAFERLKSGQSLLASDLDTPPTGLVKLLSAYLGKVHLVGPSALGGNTFERMNDGLLRNGIRQSVVKGKEVRWERGKWALFSMVASRLWKTGTPRVDLLGQLIALNDRYCIEFGQDVELPRIATREEMSDAHLVRHLGTRMVGTTAGWSYFRVDPAWSEFHSKLLGLIDDICSATVEALQSGRIIAAQDSKQVARFLRPSEVKLPPSHPQKSAPWFCLTSALPKEWFDSLQDLETKRKDAAKFAEFVLLHFREQGRSPTAKDIQLAIGQNFDLSDTAAKTAWAKVPRQMRKDMFNPKVQKRVKLEEINALYETWGAM